jgi:hypothetical protein
LCDAASLLGAAHAFMPRLSHFIVATPPSTILKRLMMLQPLFRATCEGGQARIEQSVELPLQAKLWERNTAYS